MSEDQDQPLESMSAHELYREQQILVGALEGRDLAGAAEDVKDSIRARLAAVKTERNAARRFTPLDGCACGSVSCPSKYGK